MSNDYDLDLNIDNYTTSDLERFLRIDSKKKYNADLVEQKVYTIREQLLNSGNVDKRFQRELLEFLSKAKQLLIFAKCEPPPTPTIIPTNYQTDSFPNVPRPDNRERDRGREELIKTPPTKSFIYATESPYNEGAMNPFEVRSITKCLTVNSKYRDNPASTSSTDFMFKLPDKLNKVFSVCLNSFEIPFNFYNISAAKNNSHFLLYVYTRTQSYDDIPIRNEQVIKISDGNYAQQQLIDTFNAAICPKNVDGTMKYPLSVFSYLALDLDIDPVTKSGTGKVSLVLSANTAAGGDQATYDSILSFGIDFRYNTGGNYDNVPIINKVGANFGMTQAKYHADVSISQVYRIQGENIINVFTIQYIFLVVDEYANNKSSTYISAFNESMLDSNILARITVVGSPFYQMITRSDYNLLAEPRKYHGPIDLQRFRIRLVDDLGANLDITNSDWSFCLTIKQCYE